MQIQYGPAASGNFHINNQNGGNFGNELFVIVSIRLDSLSVSRTVDLLGYSALSLELLSGEWCNKQNTALFSVLYLKIPCLW